ncbi:MAG: phosphoribosyltransferase family protein, partial [Patescibacteria group bacterium]
VSLLRGGAILGDYLSLNINALHYPLVSVKVTAPHNPELAIGAICFDVTYINTKIANMLNLSNSQIAKQIKEAEKRFVNYCTRFNVNEKNFDNVKDKIIAITDDGVATGSTLFAAIEFIKSKNPNQIILVLPIASSDFKIKGVNKSVIVYTDPSLTAISQYYKNFPQVKDEEIKKLKSLKINSNL